MFFRESFTMSHRILNVNVSLQSINQPQLCEQMLDAMTRDDRDSLLMVTSTQRISISSKLLQIFSPLYRDILRDIPSKDNDPVTLIIPDTEAVHVQHLLDLLTGGKITKIDRGSSKDIVTLAQCFKIKLKEGDLSDMEQKSPPRIKVKNIEEMSSMVPSPYSLIAEEWYEKPDTINSPNVINIDDENELEDSKREMRCAFCLKVIGGGKKSLKYHEENQCRKRHTHMFNSPIKGSLH